MTLLCIFLMIIMILLLTLITLFNSIMSYCNLSMSKKSILILHKTVPQTLIVVSNCWDSVNEKFLFMENSQNDLVSENQFNVFSRPLPPSCSFRFRNWITYSQIFLFGKYLWLPSNTWALKYNKLSMLFVNSKYYFSSSGLEFKY